MYVHMYIIHQKHTQAVTCYKLGLCDLGEDLKLEHKQMTNRPIPI